MKPIIKVLFGIIVSIILGCGFFVIMRTPRKGNCPLVIGMMSGWAPFMVVNDQGNFEGFDVDVAQELGKRLSQEIEIQDIGSLASLLLALEQGSIQCALSGLDITQNRMQKLRMIPYTGTAVTSFFLLFNNNVPQNITCMQDLQRLNSPVICVEPGSSQEKFLDQFPWITTKSLSKIEDMVLDVTYGKSFAMLVEPQVASRLMRKKVALAAQEIPIPKAFQTFGMGIALQKKSRDLAQRIEIAVQQMRSDGTLARLEKQWDLFEEQK